jgi:hypothetical protein
MRARAHSGRAELQHRALTLRSRAEVAASLGLASIDLGNFGLSPRGRRQRRQRSRFTGYVANFPRIDPLRFAAGGLSLAATLGWLGKKHWDEANGL